MCGLLPFGETPPHLTHGPALLTQQCFCDARTAVDEPAQGVGSGGLLCYFRMMPWLNTCMSLLLPEAMVHINCKHTLCCMQKITQKSNTLFLVTSIHFGIQNPVPSWYCRCCIGDWYKLLSVMHTHLLAYSLSSSLGVDQCECDGSGTDRRVTSARSLAEPLSK